MYPFLVAAGETQPERTSSSTKAEPHDVEMLRPAELPRELESDAQANAINESFPLDRYRFAVAFGIFLLIFGNNLLFGTFAAVTPTAAIHFGVSSWTVNLLNLVNAAMTIPSTWPTTWLIDSKGIRAAGFVAALLTSAGALLRWLSFVGNTAEAKTVLLFAGSVLIGLAGPVAQDSSTKAAAHWFSGEARLTANNLMSLGTPLGVAVGQFIGPMIVSKPDDIDLLNFVNFAIATVCCLGGSFLAKNNPASPPSASAKRGTVSYKDGLKQIGPNLEYWLLVFVGSVPIATLATMTTFTSNYLTPYGYPESLGGNLAVAMFIGGIVTAVVLSRVLDFTKAHITAMKVLCLLLLAGTSIFYVGCILPNQDIGQILTYVGCTLGAMGGMPMVSLAMELCAESTFPVAEATSSGTLILFSQSLLVIMILASNALTEPVTEKMDHALILLIVVTGTSFVLSLFYNATNRRIELEKKS
ncbi:Major facilitator super domain-containing protein 7 [Podochytrium sp. JEL0797]|nr:Major facilitator super domain-containing protein 7 [Podochytrium sp. JEL0797]